MHPARFVLAALCLPLVLSAQDSTAAPQGDQTLMQRLGLDGLHVAVGGGATPYMGRNTDPAGTGELRVGATFRRWPAWTIAFAASGVGDWDTTTYVVPNSNGYHPHLAATTSGFEVQRRWSSSSLVHLVATAGAGQLVNSYDYYYYPKSGGSEFHKEEVTSVSYVTFSGGGELNIASWARVLFTAGYRGAGATRIPAAVGTNSGVMSTMLFEFGKF
jgi:hypothetical protein